MGKTGCEAEGALALNFAERYQKEAEAVISSPARIELAGNLYRPSGRVRAGGGGGSVYAGRGGQAGDRAVNLYSEGLKLRLDFSSTEMRLREKTLPPPSFRHRGRAEAAGVRPWRI